MSSTSRENVAEDLDLLDRKLKQLRNEYEQYFLGSRPREPLLLRGEVQKLVGYYSNVPIRNTALRFRFNNLTSRFFAFRRQWERVLRQIENGTYERHVFRARLHERKPPPGEPVPEVANPVDQVYEDYLRARRECGEDVKGLSRERLRDILDRQGEAIRQRYGCKEVRFRVVVEGGKARLKASAVGAAKSG